MRSKSRFTTLVLLESRERLSSDPCAIALYASRPLSPGATQHSLPSGRYSLLGPAFHRLDRTSLRLAHSLDHLVGGYEERIGHREVECLGGFEVDDKSVHRWLLKWQIARFLAAQNTVDVGSGLAKHCGSIRTVGDQSSSCRKRRIYGDCGNAVACQKGRHCSRSEKMVTSGGIRTPPFGCSARLAMARSMPARS